MEELADEVVSVIAAENFHGVGQFYSDFSQTTDEEVRAYLEPGESRWIAWIADQLPSAAAPLIDNKSPPQMMQADCGTSTRARRLTPFDP